MDYYFKCPNCDSNKDFTKVPVKDTPYSIALFFIGGIMLYLLHTSDMRNKIQCDNCQHQFHQPPLPGTSFVAFSKWIFNYIVICLSIVLFLMFFPGFINKIPENMLFSKAIEMVEENAKLIALTMFPMILILVLYLLVSSINTKIKARIKIKDYFKLKVKDTQTPSADPQPDSQSTDDEPPSIVPPEEDSDTHPPLD